MHVKQKARLRPELSPKFLSTLGLNPAEPEPKPKSPARLTTLPLPIQKYYLCIQQVIHLLNSFQFLVTTPITRRQHEEKDMGSSTMQKYTRMLQCAILKT